jgi:hypothetical protein
MLHASKDSFVVKDKRRSARSQLKEYRSVDARFKVVVPVLKNVEPVVRTDQVPNLMQVARFRRILAPKETKLCRTCFNADNFKPKLFKRRP